MTRTRAQQLLRAGGERLARLDERPAAHAAVLAALRVLIPRQFDARYGADLEAVFELRVRDPQGGRPTPLSLEISGGQCLVKPGPASSPGAVATIGADDMIRLASGTAAWPDLLSAGRLKMSGDPFLALRFPLLFGLPVR